MKIGFNIVLVACAILFVFSCNNNPDYSDMLKAQEKAIQQLKDEYKLEILKDYPSNGVFKDNQFVILPNGVYLNVIDSGNGNRAVSGSTSIFCRFYVRSLIEWTYMDDTTTVDFFRNGTEPIVYKYGNSSPTDDSNSSFFFSTLLFSGLEYAGDSSEVKLIIPFHTEGNNSTFKSAGVPLYFSKVRYCFEPK
ncbi:MAG: DUF4827 domain-containing protein [Tannerellaceae bacterium]|jgi:hypothetical protein|nr:DUF4827 domain-containing protein [Tannerellaceae bacterium]